MIRSPIDLLLPYQRPIFDDAARFEAWCSSRQVGKSFTGAGKCVRRAMSVPKSDVLVVSPSERQSFEAVIKCRDWADAFKFSIDDILEERDSPGALMKAATVIFPNKSRIIAVPGKPDTVRGFSADVWMDEFAFFEDPDATWKAIFPTISNPLKGLKKLFVTSTPNGKSGRGRRFYNIMTQPEKGGWSTHTTTIVDAAPSLGTDVEALRRAIDDEEAWAQEYMCSFLDGSNVLLPYDLITSCEDPTLQRSGEPSGSGPLFVGIDFGRTSDPTVCVTLERVGDVLRCVDLVTLKGMSTPDQLDVLRPRIRASVRASIDYTGPGIGFGDLVEKEFKMWAPEKHTFGKADLCTFTARFKREIFPSLRVAFERRDLRIPADVDLREDLHEMQQIVHNGDYTYAARRTAEGHSDRCTALALALHAASLGNGFVPPPIVLDAPVMRDPDFRRL